MSKLGNLIRYLCISKGIQLKEVAEKMGITPSTLSQNIAKDNPRPSTFRKLAEVFDIPGGELFAMYDSLGDDDTSAHFLATNQNKTENLRSAYYSKSFDISENGRVAPALHATVEYCGHTFEVDSIGHLRRIVHTLSSAEAAICENDNERADAILSLLDERYGNINAENTVD